MAEDDGFDLLLDWLDQQPEGGTVAWSASGFSASQPWDCGWVDLQLHGHGDLALNWALTIESPGDDSQDETTLAVEYDGELRMTLSADQSEGRPQRVCLWTAGAGEQELAIGADIDWPAYQQTEPYLWGDELYPPLAQRHGRVVTHPVWTEAVVTAAVAAWLDERGRGDLRVSWDPARPEPDYVRQARQRLEEIGEGQVELIDLGDGVMVHPDLFDQLANDPEAAGRVIGELKQKLRLVEPMGSDEED